MYIKKKTTSVPLGSFLGLFWGVVPKFAFNKVVSPWIWTNYSAMVTKKVGGKGTGKTMRMQNQAKLAVAAHQRDMAKHTNKCLHWSTTAMSAASCAQLLFEGAILLIQNSPPEYLENKLCLKLPTYILDLTCKRGSGSWSERGTVNLQVVSSILSQTWELKFPWICKLQWNEGKTWELKFPWIWNPQSRVLNYCWK